MFPRHLLNDGEEVFVEMNPHWWYFSRQVLSLVPLITLFVFAALINKSWAYYLWAAIAVLWFVWALRQYFMWRSTTFVVTSDRLVSRNGLLSKKSMDIPLESINSINVHQTLGERLLSAGDLVVESAAQDGKQKFSNISEPEQVAQEINRQRELNQRRANTPMHQGQGHSIPAQLEALVRLHEKGRISDEEYNEKRQKLLDQM
ncbi:MAG: PH domain-containing protein [Acidimicrobiia bacterium]|nr:PH domain-containing protein [Acidimicrobiia bacterium]